MKRITRRGSEPERSLPRVSFRLHLMGAFVGLALVAGWDVTPASAAEPGSSPGRKVNFNREVRPILAKNCFACHGQDEAKRARGLRLDVRDAATRPLKSGETAIVPGDVESSALIFRVTEDDETVRMPPAKTGNRLGPAEVDVLRRWIEQGADYARHWAWTPPEALPLPKVHEMAWPRNGIDFWILARLEKEGLKPSPEADRYTLLRRASLDLRGLPPTPREVERFIQDPAPDAYERTVDRFLDDPAYGERWARMWLDLARYADSAGLGSDPLRPNIWRYRDWVIDAFNRNVPYDRFTLLQIAGDLLPDPSLEDRIATAFHRNTMTNTEGGTDDEEFRVAAIKDRADTTAQVWMGLTMGCAKCHSHKFDPITHDEYYGFYAFFNQSADNDQPDESPTIPAPTPEYTARLRDFDARRTALQAKLDAGQSRWELSLVPADSAARKGVPKEALAIVDTAAQKRTKPQSEALARHYRTIAPESKPIRDELAALEKSRPKVPTVPVMVELPADRRRVSRVLRKGNFLDPAEPVVPGVPRALHPYPPGAPANRLGLARWLIDPKNPLTARVAVNRYWSQVFGAGLVETEEDFGTQGEPPSHPELLDWLAVRYRESGWDTKALLRLIVTSATYRQSSKVRMESLPPFVGGDARRAGGGASSSSTRRSAAPSPSKGEGDKKDPRNRLLSRAPRVRLEAEMVRDQALALSGLLSRKVGGPSIFPPQPAGLWQAAFNGERTWTTSQGEDRYRRGLYVFWRRTVPYPSMATFDAPSREICAIKRVRTNTPLQSFVTMNDPVYVEAAQALARRIVRDGGTDVTARARYALQLCQGRPPRPEHIEPLVSLHDAELARYRKDLAAATALATDPIGPLPTGMDPADLAAWTTVANVLLNLDSVLTKG